MTWSASVCDDVLMWSRVSAVRTNITERRRAEDALRRSDESYRALVQHATYGIYRSSVAGRFFTVNPALVRMLAYESEDQLRAVDLERDVYATAEGRRPILATVQAVDAAR